MKATAKKRGGAAALRALNIQHDQAATPASVDDRESSPAPPPKQETWAETKRSKKGPSPSSEAFELFDRALSPASSASSSGASDRPLAQTVLQANGGNDTKTSSPATASKGLSEPPFNSLEAGPSSESNRNTAPTSDTSASGAGGHQAVCT